MKKLHPFSVTLAGAVALCVVCVYIGVTSNTVIMSASAAVLYILLGLLVGRTWSVYPWQISIVGSLPSWIFLLWRILSISDQYAAAMEASRFSFLPMISLVTVYFGSYAGRWMTLRRKMKDVK